MATHLPAKIDLQRLAGVVFHPYIAHCRWCVAHREDRNRALGVRPFADVERNLRGQQPSDAA
jgi:hypothetical protein